MLDLDQTNTLIKLLVVSPFRNPANRARSVYDRVEQVPIPVPFSPVQAISRVESIPGWMQPGDAEKLYELAHATRGPILEIGVLSRKVGGADGSCRQRRGYRRTDLHAGC